MKKNAASAAERGDFADRLERAGLVVCRHDGNERGLRREGGGELVEVDAPERIDRQPRHAEAFLFLQMLERLEHRVVLGGAGDEMFAARRVRPCQADDREVVRLRAAAGEDDFMGLRAEQRGQPVARIVDRRPRLAPRGVDARGVAKVPLQIRPHRVENLRRERGGGVVVEVDQGQMADDG